MSRQALALEIRQRRLNKSWSQSQLAEMANLSLRTIQRLEKSGQCSHETLLALADVFDVDVSEFTQLIGTNMKEKSEVAKGLPRKVIMGGVIFIGLVILLTVFIVLKFSYLYSVIDRTMMTTENTTYPLIVKIAGGILGIYGAVLAAYIGLTRKVMWGLIGLGACAGIVVLAFSFLPWIYFPYDQYSAAALWVFSWFPVTAAIWIIVMLLGKWFKILPHDSLRVSNE